MILVERNLLVVTELATSWTQCSSSCFLREISGGGRGRGCRYDSSFTGFYRPQTKFAKVMFLHLSVILFTGGKYLGRCPPGRYTPLGRYTLRAGTPPGRYTPAHPRQCMLGYGQQAGGTHPTGMHSCLLIHFC